jgi:hypothetical protein
MVDYEKLGVFYLGRQYDMATGAVDELVLYDSKDLTTHGVIVGMTGSGKTGLGIALLEEAAIDGIPSIVVDPKGDLGNLLLSFPKLEPADFQPWIDREEASRKGQTIEEYAASIAGLWKKGLGDWQQSPERIAKYRGSVDIAIYTPGSSAGLPLSILRSLQAPGAETVGNDEALRERVAATASGLLALLGISADPLRSREHILLSNILDNAWRGGRSLDMGGLIREIQSPPFKTIGVMDLEAIFPAGDRMQLAMSVNNVLASPGFAAWSQGEPLNIQRLLYTPEGKPRMSILSIAHLSDNERQFFVTILLNELIAWMRAQPGTSSLRALFYMDELFGYLPPTANPPTKTPLLTLLKQARAYGVGLVLATQNPVDLDYKALSNAGTWFLGRLQTERDKARVLDGLEGASATAGQTFDRAAMERTLSGLGNRVFLMNNVHEDQPVVFQTRWVLNYLRGPLTREQIGRLMADRKATAVAVSAETVTSPGSSTSVPPLLGEGIQLVYVPVSRKTPRDARIVYRPAVIGRARLHYVDSKSGIDVWTTAVRLAAVGDSLPADIWDGAETRDPESFKTELEPVSDAAYGEMPIELTRPKSYAGWTKSLKEVLYRDAALTVLAAPDFKEVSKPGETEGDFRVRLTQRLREHRDTEVEKLRQKYAVKLGSLADKLRRAQQRREVEATQASSAKTGAFLSAGMAALGALFSRKKLSSTNLGKAASSMRAATRASEQAGDVARAEENIQALKAQQEALESELNQQLEEIQEALTTDNIEIVSREIAPRKGDIAVDQVTLCWLPFVSSGAGLKPGWDA